MKHVHRLVAGLLLAASAVAGGDCLEGTGCSNACPLAKEAIHRYSAGSEALLSAGPLRDEFVARVLSNLRGI